MSSTNPNDNTSSTPNQFPLGHIPGPKPGFSKMQNFHARPFPPDSSSSTNTTTSTTAAQAPQPPKTDEKASQAILDGLERESKEWDKDSEISRILNSFALDAYTVLDLQPGVPETTIIAKYRKTSLLIHPDKTSNPSAPAAFDKLKKAQTELLDEKARTRLDEAIADARMLLMREKGLTKDSDEMRPDSMTDDLKKAWREKTKEVLIDNEVRRRKQLKAQMAEEGREQKKQEEEIAERKRKREAEVAWENSRDDRINSWRSFAGAKKGTSTTSSATGVDSGTKKKKKLKVLG